MKKYEFIGEVKKVADVTLNRIRAVRDFGDVKAGDVGGWIEKEENLSHKNNAWIYDNAQVYSNAQVCGNAQIHENARVVQNAKVDDDAWISGMVRISGNAVIKEAAEIFGTVHIQENATIGGCTRIFDNAQIFGNAQIASNAQISGNAVIGGNAKISSNAEISKANHILVIGPLGNRIAFTTFYRDTQDEITVKCGCFCGNIDEFLKKVTETHGDSKHALMYQAAVEIAKLQIDS